MRGHRPSGTNPTDSSSSQIMVVLGQEGAGSRGAHSGWRWSGKVGMTACQLRLRDEDQVGPPEQSQGR